LDLVDSRYLFHKSNLICNKSFAGHDLGFTAIFVYWAIWFVACVFCYVVIVALNYEINESSCVGGSEYLGGSA
jgi:hypothetical protein